nr:DUF5753 domain-containing protein [Pseudonocardia sp. ICBG601]
MCAQITSIAQRACGTVALWRNVPVSGWNIQARDISALERAASRVAVWQNSTIPDVLQTAAYMHWLAVTVAANSKQRLAANILAKVTRQKILYETPSRLDVVISERALRCPSGDRGIMIDQLHWLGSLARYGRFNLWILTANAESHIDRGPSFTIYMSPNKDADDLAVRTPGDVTISPEAKPENVRHYIDQFRDYQRRSLRGDQAIEFVEGLAREMSDGRSGASAADGECDGA